MFQKVAHHRSWQRVSLQCCQPFQKNHPPRSLDAVSTNKLFLFLEKQKIMHINGSIIRAYISLHKKWGEFKFQFDFNMQKLI